MLGIGRVRECNGLSEALARYGRAVFGTVMAEQGKSMYGKGEAVDSEG